MATDDDYESAAIASFAFMHGISGILGNPPHEIEGFKAESAKMRAYSEGLTCPRWRKAFLGWCDYVDGDIAASERSYATRDEQDRQYRAEEQEREARVADLLAHDPPH